MAVGVVGDYATAKVALSSHTKRDAFLSSTVSKIGFQFILQVLGLSLKSGHDRRATPRIGGDRGKSLCGVGNQWTTGESLDEGS